MELRRQPTAGLGPQAIGELLVSTETGQQQHFIVPSEDLTERILGAFACSSSDGGIEVTVMQGKDRILWFRSAGCNPELIYSGLSKPHRQSALDAEVDIKASPGTIFVFALEQVAD